MIQDLVLANLKKVKIKKLSLEPTFQVCRVLKLGIKQKYNMHFLCNTSWSTFISRFIINERSWSVLIFQKFKFELYNSTTAFILENISNHYGLFFWDSFLISFIATFWSINIIKNDVWIFIKNILVIRKEFLMINNHQILYGSFGGVGIIVNSIQMFKICWNFTLEQNKILSNDTVRHTYNINKENFVSLFKRIK